jgi:transcription initiation factor TFIIH subunit 1
VGAAQVKLKLVLYSFPEGHTFTFTNPAPVATAEREQFKNEITNHISRNRTSRTSGQTPTDALTTSATSNNLAPPPLKASAIRQPGGTPRASSIASDRSGSGNDTADFLLRKRVLLNSPELANLHRELVMSGQITENEFWDGREVRQYHPYPFIGTRV